MEKLFISKDNTLVNLSNSILNYFGVKPFHSTLTALDKILKETKKEKVALVLFDGFGKVIADYYKESILFIYKHKEFILDSIFPPTTVAATTSLTTGLYPIETGHIGWSQYFSLYKRPINVFISNDKLEPFIKYPSVQQNLLKPVYIWELINKTKKFNAASISSYEKKTCAKEDDMVYLFENADKLVKTHDFVYIYSSYPDHLLHDYGCFNEKVKENLIFLENKLKKLVEENKDTLFLLVADHGFHDCEEISIKEHQDFYDLLDKKYFVIEPTFASFFVKNKEKFLELANKYYSDNFFIYSKEELLKDNILGFGKANEYALETLGDFFLISKNKCMFYDGEHPVGFKGAHASGKEEDKKLYLFAFNK